MAPGAIKRFTKAKAGKGSVGSLVRWAGRVGFTGAHKSLAAKPGVKDPKRLAGWLKGQARRTGQLSRAHGGGRRKAA